MLPMLTVSGAPGLVYLNGRLCGETGVAAMPLARDGVQYLELRPFEPERPGAVLRLNIVDGRLVDGITGDVFAVQWPGGWISLELRDGWEEMGESEPRLLSRVEMPGGLYLLVNEGGVPSFGRDSQEAVFLPVEGVEAAALRPLAFPGVCVAEGECNGGRFAAVLRGQDAPEIIQCVFGPSAQVDSQGALHCVESHDDLVGHASRCVYMPDAQGRYSLKSREAAWLDGAPRWPVSAADTARAWLEALTLGAHDEAMGYLLRPELAGRFTGIAGAFETITPLPDAGAEGIRWGVVQTLGSNIAAVRQLNFQVVRQPTAQGEWKLSDIAEGLCD